MTRLLFPDAGSRWAVGRDGRPAAGHTFTVYSDAAGTILADILADVAGTPGAALAGSKVTTDAGGFLPIWWGPNTSPTVDRLWLSDGVITTPWPVDAVNNERIDALTVRVDAIETNGVSGGGAVSSVAGRTGVIVLSSADVSGVETPIGAQTKADVAGAAATATAGTYTDTTTASAVSTHNSHTTNVHGILDTATLETQPSAQAKADAAAAASIPLAQKGVALGVATLDGTGKLATAQLPPLSIVTYLGPTGSQAAMLALTGQSGDWTTRLDTGTTWLITGATPSQLSSWTELSYPTAPVTSVAGRVGSVVLARTDVGLANVDNTADTGKPVSSAQQTALDLKAPLASPTFTGTVAGVSKAMVGLGSADNTTDVGKPISTATQTALDTKVGKGDIVLRPEDYGAVGDGITDDTAAVRSCFNAANALRRASGLYADPGATVQLRARYNLATLAAPIDVMCNVRSDGAFFTTPSGYAAIAVRVGHTTAGSVMQNMQVILPSVIGATVGSPPLPIGGVGVQVRNLYSSNVTVGKIAYHETGLHVGGESWGVAYNHLQFQTITFTKVAISLTPINSGGWVNHNTFIAGSVTGSTAWAGRRASGYRGVVLNGVGSTSVNGNTFIGCSFEGDVYEHVFEFRTAYQNQFYGCRHEQGIAAAACTVSGDTVTSTAHVLAVGDMMMFTGSSAAGGMSFDQPYFVVLVPDANTFKVAVKRGGTAITFTSAGISVAYSRPQRVKYDTSAANVIDLPMTPVTLLDQIFVGSGAFTAGNVIRYPQLTVGDGYAPATWPIARYRNRATGSPLARQPVLAVYPPATSPVDDPSGWTTAVSDKGIVYSDGTTEQGAITQLGGVLLWTRPADVATGTNYEVATCRRAQSLVNVAPGLVMPAATTTGTTFTLTGTAVSDHCLVTPVSVLPVGVAFSHAYVSATNTVTIVLANLTAAQITTPGTLSFNCVVFRRFF